MDFLNPKIRTSDQPSGSAVPGSSGASIAPISHTSLYNRVINYCLVALVFLIPVFFLPLTSEIREFNKQSLLIAGALILLAVWVIKVLTTRSVRWVKTSLDYVLIGYVLVYLITSWFSIDKPSSFLGYYGRFANSAISVFAMVLMYFVVVNNVRGKTVAQKIMDALIASSAVVSIYSMLQLLGIYILPAFTHSRSFNPIGSMVGLSIFSAVSIIVYQWQLLADPQSSVVKKSILGVLTLLSLAVMFMINAFIGWLVLALGMIIFLALGMVIASAQGNNWFWKPMLVLVVAILFVAFQILPATINPRNLVSAQLPIEIQLSNSTTFNLVKNSMTTDLKTAALGSGPGTTGIAFGQIKPESLNKTVVWSLNFDRASTELANIAIETGILGLLVFEAASILFLLYGLFFLLRRVNHPGRMYAFGFFMVWATLYLAHFFYFYNTTFYFLYWLSIALFMAVAHWNDVSETSEDMSMSTAPRTALSWMFASLLMLALILVGAFFEASVYVAEASYHMGVKSLNSANPNFEKVAVNFDRARTLNPYRDVYQLALAQDLIFLSSIEAAKDEPNIQNINNWIQNAIAAGRTATQVSPNKAGNWSALAQIYNAIQPLGVQGTAQAAIDPWKKAIEHDSKNPALYVHLASAYSEASTIIDPTIAGTGADSDQDGLADDMEGKIGSDPKNSDTNGNGFPDGEEVKAGFNPAGAGRLSADVLTQFSRTDNAMLEQAENALNKAIELKADLPDSYIALARVYEKEKKLADAKKVLDDAAGKFLYNADIRYEQGRITYNNGDLAKAEQIFNEVIKLQEKHANALFSLGLIYEKKGDTAKALSYYKKVREISGPNVELDTRINDLENPTPPVK